jgi:hypothetical protein
MEVLAQVLLVILSPSFHVGSLHGPSIPSQEFRRNARFAGWMRRAVVLTFLAYVTSYWRAAFWAWIEF